MSGGAPGLPNPENGSSSLVDGVGRSFRLCLSPGLNPSAKSSKGSMENRAAAKMLKSFISTSSRKKKRGGFAAPFITSVFLFAGTQTLREFNQIDEFRAIAVGIGGFGAGGELVDIIPT